MDREAEALRGRTWVTRSAAETEALLSLIHISEPTRP